MGLWAGGVLMRSLNPSGHPEVYIEVVPTPGKLPSVQNLALTGLTFRFTEFLLEKKLASGCVLSPSQGVDFREFEYLVDYLVTELSGNFAVRGSLDEVVELVNGWVDFFSQVRTKSSREKIQGLIGELTAIDGLLDSERLNFKMWTGPSGSPQDFRGGTNWAEIKTTLTRQGPLVHKISSCDQLEMPPDGHLFVVSYRLMMGATCSYSLHDLVSRVRSKALFSSAEARAYFESAVTSLGYSQELSADLANYEILEQRVFEAREGFPRVSRSMLPTDPRILGVNYALDFSGLAEFEIDLENRVLEL